MADKTPVGKSFIRTEYLDALRKAWHQRQLVLFLGSGVSLPYGIPAWEELVLDLLCEVGDSKFGRFTPAYRRVLSRWVAERFDFSPALLARVTRYRIARPNGEAEERSDMDFRQAVHDTLYRQRGSGQPPNAALPAIAELIATSEREGRRVQAVVTFNFDDLLEQELTMLGVETESLTGPTRRLRQPFPIIHPNGFLPEKHTRPDTPVILTEDDFHRATFSPYDWAAMDLLWYLRRATVLFVGLSMNDPNLRRLIDAAHLPGEKAAHFLVRHDYELCDTDKDIAAKDIDRRVDLSRSPEEVRQTTEELRAAIDTMLKRAHTYDRELFKDMGIGVLWVQHFEDVPAVLRAISDRSK